MAGLLAGKRVLITGVLTEASIAYAAARLARQEGAELLLTGFGRGLSITRRMAGRLGDDVPVLELDVADEGQLASLADRVCEQIGSDGRLDGVLHAIGFAPQAALGEGFVDVAWSDASTAIQISAWSLASLTRAVLPVLAPRSSIVALDFDATVAWPAYGWMGVAKAGLESVARYLARELGPRGVRVNCVSAGPLKTLAATSIPGFELFEEGWDARAPLGWDTGDTAPAGRACVALMSDWFPATTGEIVHVDGGFHAVGV